VSDVLEQWVTLQRAWMYLEPVFASKDIQQQLPMEAKRFAAVDRGWRKTMEATRRAPGVIKVRAPPAATRAPALPRCLPSRRGSHRPRELAASPLTCCPPPQP
jgi:hypothetical protein